MRRLFQDPPEQDLAGDRRAAVHEEHVTLLERGPVALFLLRHLEVGAVRGGPAAALVHPSLLHPPSEHSRTRHANRVLAGPSLILD